MNPTVMKAWFNLMAEAMEGTQESREAFQRLSALSGDPEEMNRWMTQFMPAAAASTANLQPEAFEEWMEHSWRMMGVVPRTRYLELLDKCDTLQRKLDKAEETIQNLRARLGKKEQQKADAQKMADTWGTLMQDTLQAQAEWMRAWIETDPSKRPTADSDSSTDEPDGTRSENG